MNIVSENINHKQIIKELAKPSLVLDDMVVVDTEYGTNKQINPDSAEVKFTKAVAGDMPLVMLNKIIYKAEDIATMKISSTDFLPSLNLTLLIRQKFVYSTSFPKDGDIVSIFVRSKEDTLKPIRNDYYITSVTIDSSRNEMGYDFMHISGVLYVPKLNSHVCQFNTGTSIDVLHKIAEELELGFASNETEMKDEQTWISAYSKKLDFIKDISSSAWKNEESFFTTFIDIFYHLNFVNVDPMFSEIPGFELGIDMRTFGSDYADYMKMIKSESNILLTNSGSAQYSKFRISYYEQKNFANAINFSTGYIKYMHYYDALLKEKAVLFSDPKTTPGSEKDKYLTKGRNNLNQRDTHVSHDWLGTLYGANGENCHPMYLYAKAWNRQNNISLKKLYLEVYLEGVNMNLRRFQVVPVMIMIEADQVRKTYNSPEDPNSTPTTAPDADTKALDNSDMIAIDKFYSGFYVIDGIEYIYESGFLKQKLTLLRREWPIPPNKKT